MGETLEIFMGVILVIAVLIFLGVIVFLPIITFIIIMRLFNLTPDVYSCLIVLTLQILWIFLVVFYNGDKRAENSIRQQGNY